MQSNATDRLQPVYRAHAAVFIKCDELVWKDPAKSHGSDKTGRERVQHYFKLKDKHRMVMG